MQTHVLTITPSDMDSNFKNVAILSDSNNQEMGKIKLHCWTVSRDL